MKITRNSVISSVLFALLVATLMALEEFYEGEMSATTAVEEVMAYLSILGVLFLLIVAPFQKVIDWLNLNVKWSQQFFKRLAIESVVVLTTCIVLGFIFGEVIHLYIDHVLEAGAVVLRTILFLLITSSLIMALLELRHLNEEKEELFILSQRLEKEKIETLYNSLKQQVNPHFLFNSLSVLSSLVHYDAKKADLFIQHFSDIYRYVLEMNSQNLVTLDKELQFLDAYLFLQRIRFGENIQLKNQIKPQEKALYLPPLSLQLIFENILKHNIISKDSPMSIDMKIEADHLIIDNSLKPRVTNESSGLGIKNLQEKYQLLNNTQPTFQSNDQRFIVALPLFKSEIY